MHSRMNGSDNVVTAPTALAAFLMTSNSVQSGIKASNIVEISML